MPKKIPQPRENMRYLGMTIQNIKFPDGTWLEGEMFCYPSGGFLRRAYATCEDGVKRLCACSVPDTYFSIPARCTIDKKRVSGFLSSSEEGLTFTQTKGNST